MATKYQLILIFIIGMLLMYILQSFGYFELAYNNEFDSTPLNGNIEVQKILYNPPLSEKISMQESGEIFNHNPTEQLSFKDKIQFFNKAYFQIADKALLFSLFICGLFFLIKKFSIRLSKNKTTQNNI